MYHFYRLTRRWADPAGAFLTARVESYILYVYISWGCGMLTKLTLTIDDGVVAKAKEYAHRKQRSVSKIVEEYLNNVSNIDQYKNMEANLKSKITDDIAGMFKDDYSGQSYKEILSSALTDKYQ